MVWEAFMNARHWAAVVIIPVSMLGFLSAAHAADKCDAIYKKYPIVMKCGKDQTCIQKNLDHRKARLAAGCKANSTYKY